jgi:hypothetical protein
MMDDGRRTCEIKSRIVLTQSAFNKNRALFTIAVDLKLRKKLIKCYVWNIALYGAQNLDASHSRSETLGKF